MADDYIEVEELKATNGLTIFQQDRAIIETQIDIAKRYPRNLRRVVENAITSVTISKSVAESCTYTLPKGKKVSGPSVVLARIVAQKMGNMRAETRVIGADQTHVTSEATCFDLESNYAVRKTIKRSIVGSSGRYSEDLITITGNAAAEIAFRNAVFAVVGVEIVDKIWEQAKKLITGDLSDETKLMARRNKLVEGFKQQYSAFKLTDEEIAKVVGKSTIDHINADDILTLIGYENTLKSGEYSFESIFRPQLVKQPPKSEDKEIQRLVKLIESAKDKNALMLLEKECKSVEERQAYDKKFKELK